MLTLPPDWAHCVGGELATQLYDSIGEPRLKTAFATLLIGASLELLIEWIRKHRPPPLLEESLCGFQWNLGTTIYVFFPDVDDRAMEKAVEYSSIVSSVTIIVPTGRAAILENACQQRLLNLEETFVPRQRSGGRRIRNPSSHLPQRGVQRQRVRHMPLIRDLNFHISFRTAMTAADLGWTYTRAVHELFQRYNRRVVNAKLDEAIRVDMPPLTTDDG